MISHFQFQPLYQNSQLPGWKFSFYFKKQYYTGIYHQAGNIEWTSEPPQEQDEKNLSTQIHDLMLFHVYEN